MKLTIRNGKAAARLIEANRPCVVTVSIRPWWLAWLVGAVRIIVVQS